jgi:aspartate kinase
VEFDPNQAKVALLRVPDRPGVAAQLFGEIGRQEVDVDLIIQSIHELNTNDIAFTVSQDSANQAEAVAAAIAPTLRNRLDSAPEEAEVMVDRTIAKVSISGAGMIGRPGVAAKMFATLAEAGVNMQMISTSEVKVSCVVDADQCDRAIDALCQAFEVSSSPLTSGGSHAAALTAHKPPVRGVALDLNQARVAIRHIPDRPGMAAKFFGMLAQENISVDTIIQSQRCHIINGTPTRDIAFTVARNDAKDARRVLVPLAAELGCGEIIVDEEIANVLAW